MKKVVAILVLLFGSYLYVTNADTFKPLDGSLIVHYLDVGQGDSIFIELPNEEVILIDGGEEDYGLMIYDYITDLGYNEIDYLIATHPHADHIGGLEYIVNNLTIENIYMPKMEYTTKTYENLLLAISEKGNNITSAIAGLNIINSENLKINIVAPYEISDDANENSVVLLLEYKENSFIFTGDIENDSHLNYDVDVVKVPHHGSSTSSSYEFVSNTSADYAIISVGIDNKYDHPNKEVLELWEDSGALVYRTDLCGNIIVTSDGNNLDLLCGEL